MAVPALMYHHISPIPGPHTVSPENFRRHLEWLSESGIRTISVSEYEQWRQGLITIREPSVLLTFDDGWLDNWVYALPLLREFNAKAVFFIVTAWPGEGAVRDGLDSTGWKAPTHQEAMSLVKEEDRDQAVMRWSELLAARESGLVELASHSHSHGEWWQAGGSWAEVISALEEDLGKSQDVLSSRLGERPRYFCWPKGLFGLGMVETARAAGFDVQFSTLRGTNYGSANSLVRRIDAENRGQEWLSSRYRLYRSGLAGGMLGLGHQLLHRSRMAKKYHPPAPESEFRFPPFSLI